MKTENVLIYEGEKPSFEAPLNEKILDIMLKQLELIKQLGTVAILVPGGTKISKAPTHEK